MDYRTRRGPLLGLGGLGLIGFSLAACAGVETPSSGTPNPANAEVARAEQACLRDVRATTGASQAKVLSSTYSEAGTKVTVGISEPAESHPWQCIGYRDGTTSEIMSLVDEGYL
jgi:hypothetical protein